MGNLRSVEKAVQFLGFDCEVRADLSQADRLILPGVGAFGAAMERLAPLKDDILEFARTGRPLLGICLGQQLLFDRSEELGSHEGLGLIPGEVKYLPKDKGFKVPHIGWSPLTLKTQDRPFDTVDDGEQVYFVHSLHTVCTDPAHVAATSDYILTFAAAVRRDNVWGVQFHPEKSGDVGLRILRSFLEC
jgi:imidazole glycerol-phosphate synthase subunit HisH